MDVTGAVADISAASAGIATVGAAIIAVLGGLAVCRKPKRAFA